MRELRLPGFAASLNIASHSIRWAGWVGLVALACHVTGQAALLLSAPGTMTGLLWPPAGIALAAVIRLGPSIWPALWIASFGLSLGNGAELAFAGAWATVHTAGPLLAGAGLAGRGFLLETPRARDLAALVFAGALAATLNAAGSVVTTLTLGGGDAGTSATPEAWLPRWLADTLGALVFGLPLLAWSRASAQRAFGSTRRVSTALLLAAALGSGWLVCARFGTAGALWMPLLLLPYVVLAGLSATSGMLAGSLGVWLVLLGAGLAAAGGHGQLPAPEAARAPSWFWGYTLTLAIVPMLASTLRARIDLREARWKHALDASRVGTAELDVKTGRLTLSARWQAMLGPVESDTGMSMTAFWDRVHPDDLADVKRTIDPLRTAAGTDVCVTCRFRATPGEWRWFELRGFAAERDTRGAPLKVVLMCADAEERQSANALRTLLDSLVRNLDHGLLVTDAQWRILRANPIYCQITGHAEQQLLGTVPALLGPQTSSAGMSDGASRIRDALAVGGIWHGEATLQRRCGEACTLRATVSAVHADDGQVQNHVLAFTDVTQSRKQIVQLQRQAHFDELTGLPNRVRLTQLLLEALAVCERDGSLLTICCLDLDHFKPVNDELGHFAGDQLLQKLAERLRRSLRTSSSGDDVVARIGGDEFVLLLRVASAEEGRLAVERMQHVVSLPFGLSAGDSPVVVTASIGATVFPLDNADAETLLRHADHAMYGAKQAGRSGYQFFDAERNRAAEARVVEIGRLQDALDAQELCLYFQPKVDMRDGRVLGVEALVRWNHPEQGLLTPDRFLPLIEHTRLGSALSDWVLRKGVEQLSQWQCLGLDLTVSINILARHLQDPMFAHNLAELLASQPTPVADRLVLEVLETTALADIDFTCELMEACRALGVRFALDDFGTGYSTLTYLKKLPLDMLKIDRSFVTHMLHDRHDMAIVEGVIGLSQTFGCSVVAEGVETLEQAQALIELGCDIGQGNGIAPAMPAVEVTAWVRNFGGMSTLAAPLMP